MLITRLRSVVSLFALGACVMLADASSALPLQDEAGPETGAVQDPPRRGRRGGQQPPEAQAPPPAAEEKKTEAKKDDDKYLAITGGRVHTMAGPVLEGVTILAKNGSIIAIGPNVKVPEGAEVIDAAGHRVYPGLVSVQSFGIVGSGRPQDTTDVFDLNMTVALAAGITTTVSGDAAVKLAYGTVEGLLLRDNLFINFRYTTRDPAGRHRIRGDLDRVHGYLRDVRAYEVKKQSDPSAKEPDGRWIRGQLEQYLRLMKGEAVAIVDASQVADLIAYAKLANDYGIKFIVRGGTEAWTIAPIVSRANMDLIVTPRERVDPDPRVVRPNGSTIENAAILHNHGVRIGIIPVGSLFGPGSTISFGGLGGRDLAHYAMEAAFGVRGGLSNDAALRAITIDAARILRIDDRVGSLEVGKDADIVIADGDMLAYTTQVRWTIVNGRIAYDKANETLYQHIRPEGDEESTPPDEYWPRRLGAPF